MLPGDYDEKRLPKLPEIHIKVIPHDGQDYPTVGGYNFDESGVLTITVSDMGNSKYEFLVAIHEVIESMLALFKGIDYRLIDNHDILFEEMRHSFPTLVGDSEPGDNDAAPYYHEHNMATRVERWLADSIGVDWVEYEKKINSL